MPLLEYIKEFFIKIGSLIYNKALQPILGKLSELFRFVNTHRQLTIGIFLFLLYLVLSYVFMFSYDYFGYNEYNYITNIIFIVVGVGFLFSLLNKYYSPKQGMEPTVMNVFKRLFLIVMGISIVFGLIYVFSYASFYSNMLSMFLTITGTLIALYALNKYLNNLPFVQKIKSNRLFSILYHLVFLIPCLIFDGGVNVYNEIKNSKSFILKLLLAEILIIASYFLIPRIIEILYTHDSKLLLNKPLYLDKPYTIGKYEDLVPKKSKDSDTNTSKGFKFKYNYGLSCWIFLDNVGPNYNNNITGFVNLLSYGDKPSIKYNVKTQTLRVTSQKGIDGTEIIYETSDLPLQRWNNFVINYDGGNTDVFINGTLVGTKAGVIPYMKYDNVNTGQANGLPGGICNVQYYNSPLSRTKIDLEYSTLKNKTPPIIS